MHAVEAARLAGEGGGHRLPAARRLHTRGDIEQAGEDDPRRQQQAQRDERFPLAEQEGCRDADDRCSKERPAQRAREFADARLLPARQWRRADQEKDRQHQRNEHRVEVGGPTESLPRPSASISSGMGYGVMSTPGVVDGEVVHAGGIPSKASI